MRQKLAYTDADLLEIAMDDQEFARLKAGLKHKGAVTNEVLKQKLYAFVAKSKLRKSGSFIDDSGISPPNSPKRQHKGKTTDDLRSRTMHTSTTNRW